MAVIQQVLVLGLLKVLACTAVKNPAPNIVQWQKPPDGYANEVFYDLKPGQELKYYAGWRNMTIVFLTRPEDFKMRLDCRLMQLPEDARITKVRLLYGIKDTTLDPRPKPYIHRFKDMEEMDWTVDYTDNRIGPIFSITLPKDKKIKLRKIKCRVENAVSETGSNPLYIVDYRQAFVLDVKTVALASSISANQPSQFPCREVTNAELFRPLTYEWFTVKDGKTVESLRELGQQLSWPVQILPDGTLYWPYVSSKARESLQGKKLLCKVEGIKAAETTAALNIAQDGSSANAVTSLEMFPYSSSTLSVIPRQLQPPVLSCPFKAGPGSYDVKWQWEGKDLKEGKNEEGVVVSGSQLRLEGPIDETKQSASISCQVTWTPQGGTKETKTTELSVKLLHIPRFSNKVPSYCYAFDGGNASVTCQIRKGSDFEVGFILDGTELAAYDRPGLLKKLQKLSTRFGMDFKGDIDLLPKDVPDGLRGKSRTYTAIDMKMKKGSTRSTAFILQCRLFGPQIKKTERLDVPDGFSLQPLKTVVMTVISRSKISKKNSKKTTHDSFNFCAPLTLNASLMNCAVMDYPDVKHQYQWFVLYTKTKTWQSIDRFTHTFSTEDGGRTLTVTKDKAKLLELGLKINGEKVTSSLKLACLAILRKCNGEEINQPKRWEDLEKSSVALKGTYVCGNSWGITLLIVIVFFLLIVFVLLVLAACCNWFPHFAPVAWMQALLMKCRCMKSNEETNQENKDTVQVPLRSGDKDGNEAKVNV